MTSSAPSPWVLPLQPKRKAPRRLLCFPFAGGGTLTYVPWAEPLDGELEVWGVSLPGRERRFAEAPVPEFWALVTAIAAAAREHGPWAGFFGHSLGALLAFETCRALRAVGAPEPERLFVSAARTPDDSPLEDAVADLPEPQFRERLRTLGGTPPDVLANEELMTLVGPRLRADFAAVEDYRYRGGTLCSAPITAFAGDADTLCPPAAMARWGEFTEGAFCARTFPGGHFFLQEQRAQLLAVMRESLRTGLSAR